MYQKESLVVLAVLIAPFFITKHVSLAEIIAAIAVFFTFQHAAIADRMQERQAAMTVPDVECHWKSIYYFCAKEALWVTFFIMSHSWSAVAGAVIFFCYPFWRKFYRKCVPLNTMPATITL